MSNEKENFISIDETPVSPDSEQPDINVEEIENQHPESQAERVADISQESEASMQAEAQALMQEATPEEASQIQEALQAALEKSKSIWNKLVFMLQSGLRSPSDFRKWAKGMQIGKSEYGYNPEHYKSYRDENHFTDTGDLKKPISPKLIKDYVDDQNTRRDLRKEARENAQIEKFKESLRAHGLDV